MRTIQPRPQRFRVRYFATRVETSGDVLSEVELTALDADHAIEASASMPWPRGAIGLCIVDNDGREVFERPRSDWP